MFEFNFWYQHQKVKVQQTYPYNYFVLFTLAKLMSIVLSLSFDIHQFLSVSNSFSTSSDSFEMAVCIGKCSNHSEVQRWCIVYLILLLHYLRWYNCTIHLWWNDYLFNTVMVLLWLTSKAFQIVNSLLHSVHVHLDVYSHFSYVSIAISSFAKSTYFIVNAYNYNYNNTVILHLRPIFLANPCSFALVCCFWG